MKLSLPGFVEAAIRTIERAGHESYVVGGALRDQMLGRSPKDWDLATSAPPEAIEGLFPRHVSIGKRFGTIQVWMGERDLQITTYRVEKGYSDARHPDEVRFISSIEEDLSRRDFTINALAWHPRRGWVDLWEGRKDLRKKLIRTVGNPITRFQEDPLRMLRAARFASQLNFRIAQATTQAARECAPWIERISAERIGEEMSKMLLGVRPAWGWMERTGLGAALGLRMPSRRVLQAMLRSPSDASLRWTLFLLDEPHPAEKLKGLRKERSMIRDVEALLKAYRNLQKARKAEDRRRLLHDLGATRVEVFLLLLQLMGSSSYRAMAAYAKEKIFHLALTGEDILALGVPAGKTLGLAIQSLKKQVFIDPSCNRKPSLRKLVRAL